MKVKILRQTLGHIEGVSLRHYKPNETYEVPPSIANYLVAEGIALFEMRNPEERTAPPAGKERRGSKAKRVSRQ